MPIFKIQFTDSEKVLKPFDLEWEILDSPAARAWTKLLMIYLKADFETSFRFVGFIHSKRDYQFLSNKLNEAIRLINQDGRYHIIEQSPVSFTQEFSNIIHHHFEVLSQTNQETSQFYADSPTLVAYAIDDLNYYIHEMESLTRGLENYKNDPSDIFASITNCFQNFPKFSIPDSFSKYFTLSNSFGDIVMQYSQIGKTLWEVFIDNDDQIYDGAIIAHQFLTPEFDILFGEVKNIELVKSNFFEFLKDRGLNPNDEKLRLGFLPLAKLIYPEGMGKEDIIKALTDRLTVNKITLLDGDDCSYQKGFTWKSRTSHR
jgi:hypothetical protein